MNLQALSIIDYASNSSFHKYLWYSRSFKEVSLNKTFRIQAIQACKSFFIIKDHTCFWDRTCKRFRFIYRHWTVLESSASRLCCFVVLRLVETFIASCLGGAVHTHEWYAGYHNAAEQGDCRDDHLSTLQRDVRPLFTIPAWNLSRRG